MTTQCSLKQRLPFMTSATFDNAPAPITASLLNKDALAARLRLSARTLDNMVEAREFPLGVRIGKFVCWTEAAVTACHT